MVGLNVLEEVYIASRLPHSYICKAGMYLVFVCTLQYNPPLVSYSARITKIFTLIQIGQCSEIVSRGRKSMLLFKSGKWLAVALMTSVGFGVT